MKKKRKNKNILINKKLIFIILGIIVIALILYFVFIKIDSFEKINSNQGSIEKDIKASFEWRDPKTITPYGGRFYNKCSDGTNLGKVWANIKVQPKEEGLSYTCKITIIVNDTGKYVDNYQLNLGANNSRSSFIGFTEELAKKHLIEVCCKTKTDIDSFCKTFEFAAYC